MTAHALQMDGVGYGYGDVPALSDINFTLPAGTFTAITGPSGCGKSTLIALAAGLLAPDAGRVKRTGNRLGVVFQDPTLLPWKTAQDNVAFPLIAKGASKSDCRAKASNALAAVGLSPEDAGKFPRELSGGMRQRVALARALVIEPDLLLCDEPFGALDENARMSLRQGFDDLQKRTGLTTLLVTHDRQEALDLADTVIVMSKGRIEQIDPPAKILSAPANDFVRSFFHELS